MTQTYALAPLPQQTLVSWHRFVATGAADQLAPLLAQDIVFRSPFVQAPIPGHAATLLVLTGEPLGEPVFGYGPFVMTNEKEIRQAIDDFNGGRFGQVAPQTAS